MKLNQLISQYIIKFLSAIFILSAGFHAFAQQTETKEQKDVRMKWWREARFGMFIHWGLYAIPAGEWKGETNHAEWIRNTAKIPLEEYERFVSQFNPNKFNANEWAKLANEAGMKYIVITSKHHDGFCLFNTQYTDFDIMSTPFKRDIMGELSKACASNNLKMCWYHSIMDWHHPDYLPRRDWETSRTTEGADFDRFLEYLKNQLKELVTNYGKIGVLWFDGEWEKTWNHQYGQAIYDYLRKMDPDLIINNRVDVGRDGMAGISKSIEYAGDFGTPEQEVPARGIPGMDWESCITMNNNWGYNKNDHNWKSTENIIKMLCDIVSKGGNLLLNVGPTAEGIFPPEAIERLKQIGGWMKINGDAIYGTEASPFSNLKWGRCTRKAVDGKTILYFHVFDFPKNNKITIPGLGNKVSKVYDMASKSNIAFKKAGNNYDLDISKVKPFDYVTVIAMELEDELQVYDKPYINADFPVFVDELTVKIGAENKKVEIHYTLNGQEPTVSSELATDSGIVIKKTTTVKARCFYNGKPVSDTESKTFEKIAGLPAINIDNPEPGLKFRLYKGKFSKLPDFVKLQPDKEGISNNFDLLQFENEKEFACVFEGYVIVPKDGMYNIYLNSDDGSRLVIDDKFVIDNDFDHAMVEKKSAIGLAAGFHKIKVMYYQSGGGLGLRVSVEGQGIDKDLVPDRVLFR
ncbi:MAG: alpha-L-fucosidase [Bacteroidales bacterium]